MSTVLGRVWDDDRGAVISVELVLILAIVVFGLVPGMVWDPLESTCRHASLSIL